eukprot:EG_transcript_41448
MICVCCSFVLYGGGDFFNSSVKTATKCAAKDGPCNKAEDCCSLLCSSGRCLEQEASIDSSKEGLKHCKRASVMCKLHSDCCSSYCKDGICAECMPNEHRCSVPQDCCNMN